MNSVYGEIKLCESRKNRFKVMVESYCGQRETIAWINVDPEYPELQLFSKTLSNIRILPAEIERVEIGLLKLKEATDLGLNNLWIDGKTDDASLVPCVNFEGVFAQSRPDVSRLFVPKVTVDVYEPQLNTSDIPKFLRIGYKSDKLYRIINHEVINRRRNLCKVSFVPVDLDANYSCLYEKLVENLNDFNKSFHASIAD